MPVAVHIAAVPTHAASGATSAGVRGKAKSADPAVDSKAAASVSEGASGHNFGALFREQAGVVQHAMADSTAADEKASNGAGPAADMTEPAPELEESAATDARSASGKVIVGSAEEESAAASDSPQALLVAQLKSDLCKPAQAVAEISTAEPRGEAASDRASGKNIAERLSPQGRASKEEAPSGDGKHIGASTDASGSLTIMAVAAAPVAAPLIVPAKTVVAAIKQSSSPGVAGAPKSTPAQTAPATVQDNPASAENHAASVSAESPGDVARKLNLNNAGVQPVVNPAANDGVATSKALGSTVKASIAASSAQHSSITHAVVSETIAPAAAAASSIVHGSEASNPAQRTAQPMQVVSSAIAPTTNAIPPAAGSAYDRMDQGVAPVVLHSGAQHVSVGVQDPNLGWVEIKTQNLGGHVDATLVTASGQSHDALAAQLPAMAQFLEQRDVRVGALAVHHEMPGAQGGSAGNGSGGGTGSGANYGGAGQSGHMGPGSGSGQRPGGESRSPYAGLSSRLPRSATIPVGVGVNEDAVLRPVSYISVRA